MMGSSMARMGMLPRMTGRSPVFATVALTDVIIPYGAPSATITATLSHQVRGSDLNITLSNGATILVPVGATSGVSTPFNVTPGDTPYAVSIVSAAGGDFTSIDISDTATVTPPRIHVRVYKGSIVKSTSGNFPKSDLLSLSGTTAALTEIDCEAVGGGAGGRSTSNPDGFDGGTPGHVSVATVAYVDLPSLIEYAIGAGGPRSRSAPVSGGSTSITGIVSVLVSGVVPLSPKSRPTGPGQGATAWSYRSDSNNGGSSNASYPDLALPGGIGSGDSRTSATDGKDALTPFQHGSGGGSWAAGSYSGKGGWPGGGGGKGTYRSGTGGGGAGGAGAARFHVYALEPVS